MAGTLLVYGTTSIVAVLVTLISQVRTKIAGLPLDESKEQVQVCLPANPKS
jgi:hypothetical protein